MELSKGQIKVFATPESAAEGLAQEFVLKALEAQKSRKPFYVALCGGATPKLLFKVLRESPFKEKVPWDIVEFYFGDDRPVGPTHPDSNFLMASTELFEPLNIPASQIHRFQAELENAAELMEQELHKNFQGFPVFDFMLLGLGTDAHTASFFPNFTEDLETTKRYCLSVWVEKLKSRRVTLSPAVINASRNIYFFVTGESKAEAVTKIMRSPYSPKDIPAHLIKPSPGVLYWYVDRAVTKNLES